MSRAGHLVAAGREPQFVAVHEPRGAASGSAVVICPPFGWEEVCSYRARRDWAEMLADEGRLALRIQLPGMGDSGGSPRAGGLLDRWVTAVGDAVAWTRARPAVDRVAVIGLGAGGLVAWLAATGGAPIDDMILWGTPSQGRRLVRELRAFAALQASQRETAAPAPGADLEIAGHVLTAETLAALNEVDLTAHALPVPASRRVLLLDRDGLEPDGRLAAHLEAFGAPFTRLPGPGWGRMTAEPQQARAPRETFTSVSRWLDEAHGASELGAVPPEAGLAADAVVEGGAVTERAVAIDAAGVRLAGVLAYAPDAPRRRVALLLLNAGAINRGGPNRMWVEAARRWAGRGVPSLRLDVEGIGDADGDASPYVSDAGLYVSPLVDQAIAGARLLEAQAPGAQIVTIGLCSGAYWGFHAALRSVNIGGVVMLNPRALFWRDELEQQRNVRYARRVLVSRNAWRRVLRGEIPRARLLAILRLIADSARHLVRDRLRRSAPAQERDTRIDEALDQLRDAQIRVCMAFGDHEPLHDELLAGGHLEQLDRWPQLRVDRLPGAVHTLHPADAQAAAHTIIDREVAHALETTEG